MIPRSLEVKLKFTGSPQPPVIQNKTFSSQTERKRFTENILQRVF